MIFYQEGTIKVAGEEMWFLERKKGGAGNCAMAMLAMAIPTFPAASCIALSNAFSCQEGTLILLTLIQGFNFAKLFLTLRIRFGIPAQSFVHRA